MADRLVVLGSAIGALAVVRGGHRLGYDVRIVDREAGITCSSRRARSMLATPDVALEPILALGREGGRAALIATGDAWLRFVREHRAELAAVFEIPHPRDEVIDICLSKSAFSRWCEANGVPSPRTASVRSERLAPATVGSHGESDGLPPFPVIVRPDQSWHHSSAVLPKAAEARSPAALESLLSRFRQANASAAITESLLGRPLAQFSVPFARSRGETLLFVAEKLRPLSDRCSVGTYLEAQPNVAIETVARRAIERLDYEGIGEVEILHDRETGKNYVIEINPRPWTQFALSSSLGFDFLAHVLGREGGRVRSQPSRAVRWIDFRNDLYTVFSRREGMIPHSRLGWGQYLASLGRVRSFAKWDLRDPWPFVVDLIDLIRSRFR